MIITSLKTGKFDYLGQDHPLNGVTYVTEGKHYIVLKDLGDTFGIPGDHGDVVYLPRTHFSVFGAKNMPEPVEKKKIILNEAAKPKEPLTKPHDFSKLPVILHVATSDKVKGAEKASIIMNMGIAYQRLSPARRQKFQTAADLNKALTWDETPQGQMYWHMVHQKLTRDFL